jgi:hypothetical protein
VSFPLALGKFALAARRSDPAKLARTKPAASHPQIALALGAADAGSNPLISYLPQRLNQGESGSCTAHAFAGAFATRAKFAGLPVSFVPSPREVYATTRAYERTLTTPAGQALPDLTDSGADLSNVIASVGVFGIAPIAAPTPDGRYSDIWTPADTSAQPSNVNLEPDGEQLEQGAYDPLSGAYTIDPASDGAVQTANAALQAGYPLYCGFFCSNNFQELQFEQVAPAPDMNDPNGGGHAVFLVGSRTSPTVSGTTELLLCNSWGAWCGALTPNDGMVWVSEAFFHAIWEIWVIDEKLAASRNAA